jgi:hypothetical protein
MVYDAMKFLHILAVVFMSAPLYNLIVVNERVRFGSAPFAVDRYFENIIKGAAVRCYVYQLTALVTGLLLLPLAGLPWDSLFENGMLLVKLLLLLALMSLLSVVHFRIQPAIEKLLSQVKEDEIPKEIAERIAPLRMSRKRLAALCLQRFLSCSLLFFHGGSTERRSVLAGCRTHDQSGDRQKVWSLRLLVNFHAIALH